ncbi:hypothetical protein [Streptomyces sp. NPDC004629]|uniref:hypothetical protein n=1 Tax=Streptomyces sp. NPDC004629 TaxID=3364705 RepID=UPI0036BC6667
MFVYEATSSAVVCAPGVAAISLLTAVLSESLIASQSCTGILLLGQVAEHAGGTVRKALADQGFKNQVVTHGAGLGIATGANAPAWRAAQAVAA